MPIPGRSDSETFMLSDFNLFNDQVSGQLPAQLLIVFRYSYRAEIDQV